MRLKKYMEFINEELREKEFNAILDKIHKKEPLTDEEQKALDNFDGEFDTSPLNKVDFDAQGDIRIDGKRMNPYNISKELYDDEERMKDFKPTELDEDLKEYIIRHLNQAYDRRNVAGAHKKQFFDENDQLILPEEIIRKTMWHMEINDIPGVREFINKWILEE
ncbi:MAG: hypothetical protein SLAVMIC_00207 [uncultured marine phage]|uniref:Uncharacterized protein n=1 Tax=uncultured marine phage TaxID=707152 RepID=A0A8D9FQV8_9VIRU|nr:MAG: hypothetical protein SLAVMIC_00207 [uncultured marine phage]